MRTVELYEAPGARCLFVFLPGRHSRPEAFGRAGFADAVSTRALSADVLAVDAHLGYYRSRTIVERLHADVLAVRRARYDEIWVVGTSLGGLGGLLLLRDHPEDVEGVVALAPFLGDEDLISEIEEAGGPRAWNPPTGLDPDSDPGRALWSLLRRVDWPQAAPLFVGWGAGDRLARANRLLAPLLPESHVFESTGGHDMETWRQIWEQFLDRTGTCRADPASAQRGKAAAPNILE